MLIRRWEALGVFQVCCVRGSSVHRVFMGSGLSQSPRMPVGARGRQDADTSSGFQNNTRTGARLGVVGVQPGQNHPDKLGAPPPAPVLGPQDEEP